MPETVHPLPVRKARRSAVRAPRQLRLGLLSHLVCYNLRRVHQVAVQSFQNAVAPHDLTLGQFGVLVLIAENPGLSQSQLGQVVGIDRSTMVSVIDRLESRGWVERASSPADRRSHALRLSPAGRELLAELVPRVRAHERSLIQGLSDREHDELVRLLQRIAPYD